MEGNLLFLSGILMPCQILAYKVIPFSILSLILYFILITIKRNGLKIQKTGVLLLAVTLINFAASMMGQLPGEWKQSSRNQIIEFLAVVMILFVQVTKTDLSDLIKGLKYGLLFNIFWAFIQYVCFRALKMDLNDVMFNQILGIRDQASTINTTIGTFCIAGLNWHPSQLVPIIILSYLLFDSIWIKIVLVILAYISTNTTCMFSLALCCGLDIVSVLPKKVHRIKFRQLITFVLILIVVNATFFYLYCSDENGIVIERIHGILERFSSVFTGRNLSHSTMLHLRYYTAYPDIVRLFGWKSLLFGVGFECSGYPFVVLFNQYADLKSWHVESDIINFLVGRGWIWTIVYYVILIKLMIKGKALNKRYSIMVICFIVSGILYNTQVLWVEVLMLFMFVAVSKKTDVFTADKTDYIPPMGTYTVPKLEVGELFEQEKTADSPHNSTLSAE